MGEWRYTSTHFLTLALDEGEWLYSHTLRSDPGERKPMPYKYEPTWAPELYKEGEVYFSLSTIELRLVGCEACSLVTVSNELSRRLSL
jgi:hypothetical protein